MHAPARGREQTTAPRGGMHVRAGEGEEDPEASSTSVTFFDFYLSMAMITDVILGIPGQPEQDKIWVRRPIKHRKRQGDLVEVSLVEVFQKFSYCTVCVTN